MIIAERKPLREILDMISGMEKVLILGCRGCVAVCSAGGDAEVDVLTSALKLGRKRQGSPIHIDKDTLVRQCDPEYLEPIKSIGRKYDAVLSMACGVGVNFIADRCPGVNVLPALNTTFYGANLSSGEWKEMCAGCGACVLHLTGGLCPVARCAKSLSNGPCGGSVGGRCEIDPNVSCVWNLIYDKLSELKRSEDMKEIMPIRDWRTAGHGGPRNRRREDLLP
ncbi:MAG: methylenetetrahydrofolate reductase C-terminal domain-containing protein [Deltaproteobacteria bacterium]